MVGSAVDEGGGVYDGWEGVDEDGGGVEVEEEDDDEDVLEGDVFFGEIFGDG